MSQSTPNVALDTVVAATVINQASGIYQMNRQQLLVGSALAENVETKPVTDCRR